MCNATYPNSGQKYAEQRPNLFHILGPLLLN